MKKYLYKFVDLLTPKVITGGLEISDTAIRFLRIDDNNKIIQQESLRIPDGIIKNGHVEDATAFAEALRQIKDIIEPKKNQPVHVVLSMTSAHIYTQAIFLPEVADQNIDEAARLNTEMSSPIRLEYAYHGWQRIKRKEESATDKIEIFTAVVNRDVVDALSAPLKKAGFVIIAVDFTAMSLGRIVKMLHTDANKHKPQMVLYINSDGVELFIMHAGELYFNYYESWDAIRGEDGRISTPAFRDHLVNALVRLKNYYLTRFNVEIADLLVVAPGLYDEVQRAINDQGGLLNVEQLEIKEFDFPRYWYVTLGAALRAQMPRYLDEELSLSDVSTKEEYSLVRGIAFVRLWRNLAWTSLLFLGVLFVGISIFLVRYDASIQGTLLAASQTPVDIVKIQEIQQDSSEFNRLVRYAKSVNDSIIEWPPIVKRLDAIFGDGPKILELSISKGLSASILGTAPTRQATLDLRRRLMEEPGIESVNLPTESLFSSDDGPVRFTVTFRITDARRFQMFEESGDGGADLAEEELIVNESEANEPSE